VLFCGGDGGHVPFLELTMLVYGAMKALLLEGHCLSEVTIENAPLVYLSGIDGSEFVVED
jgi:hypothetical protein